MNAHQGLLRHCCPGGQFRRAGHEGAHGRDDTAWILTSFPGCGLHDGVQHGLPLLVCFLLRLALLFLLLWRHLLAALRHQVYLLRTLLGAQVHTAWPQQADMQCRKCCHSTHLPTTILPHELLHAALSDRLQLWVVTLHVQHAMFACMV